MLGCVAPYLHGAVGFDITRDLSVVVAADGLSLSNDWMLDAGAYLNYRFSDRWDATAGWQYYGRDIETDEITNRVRYDMPHLAIAYSW